MTIAIAVAGATGRMGRMLVEAVAAAADARLAGAFVRPGHPAVGQPAGAAGVAITDDARAALAGADVLIDFTRPEATLAHLDLCRELGVRAVVGTTGFDAAGRARIAEFAQTVPIVFAPNMDVGVNVVLRLLDHAARALGEGWDVEIIEAHHRHKVDAPSGTALAMGEVIAKAQGRDLAQEAVFERHGRTGARRPGSIGFSAIRGGDIVGDHTVLFAGTGERIEITHRSSTRAGYAEGSVRAARFLMDKAPGLYDMQHVLGLRPLAG